LELVIVKVRQAGYIPACVTVKASIDEFLFTADISEDDLTKIEEDPLVASISKGRKLRVIE